MTQSWPRPEEEKGERRRFEAFLLQKSCWTFLIEIVAVRCVYAPKSMLTVVAALNTASRSNVIPLLLERIVLESNNLHF